MSMHETHLCGARNSSEGDDEKDVFDMRHDCACFVCGAAVVGGRCWQAVDFLAPFPSPVRAGSLCVAKGHEVLALKAVAEPHFLWTVERGEMGTNEAWQNWPSARQRRSEFQKKHRGS